MRARTRTMACALLAILAPLEAAAQQGSVQITGAVQAIQGDPRRTGGQPLVEPDYGVSWLQPGTRFGTFQLELRGTRRDDLPHLGRTFVGVRDLAYRDLKWTLEAGDTYFSPAIGDYRFANLAAPSLTFAGGAVSARSPRTSLGVLVGRTTAWRNLFGTDPDTIDQQIALGRASHRMTDRLELSTRASHVRTGELENYTSTIESSDQGGLAARWIVTPAVHVIGDGGVVAYRRHGSTTREVDGSGLAGASLLLPRGWVQINASRFSPGELPILNQPLTDRQSFYVAGEYDAIARLRVFGGWEAFRSNLDPAATPPAAPAAPTYDGTRAFAGVRTPVGTGSSVAFRIETGDRRSRRVEPGWTSVSDTGVITAEWQTSAGSVSGLTRYSRRENVESTNLSGSYTVDDASGYLFLTLKRTSQLFGNVVATRTTARDGSGSTFLQLGGGGQTQMLHQSLWLRAEGTASRNVDVLSSFVVPQQSFNFGVNGEIARGTIIGINIAADRVASPASDASWISRSSVRVTRSFQTGSGRAPTSILGAMGRHSGTGSIAGTVFTDWNANGQQDQGERLLENIPVRLTNLGSATTSRAGEFAFINVPTGFQQVGIDLSALPVDFDPPAIPHVQLQLGRGDTQRVTFGLVPLTAISGRVILDANQNGIEDAGDTGLESAVLVLDAGARSEKVRQGRFRFEAVRSGDHTVGLVPDSLPEGAVVSGPLEIPLALTQTQPTADVLFLVTLQQRPELRKVFAPTVTRPSKATPQAPRPAESVRRPPPASRVPPSVQTPARSAAPTPARRAAEPAEASERFAVQVVALNDPLRANATMEELKSRGLSAYIVEPPASDPDAPYRVRVGYFSSRAEAEAVAAAIGKARGQRLWVVRERRAGS